MGQSTTSSAFGFVYVAVGDGYVKEAGNSARSLRQHHAHPITLITDMPQTGLPFDDVIVVPDIPRNIESKLSMNLAPYEKTIFLDSDTRILAPLDELGELLDFFDLCVPTALGGYHYKLPDVSPAFREPATNVIGFRKNEAVSNFFKDWKTCFKEYEGVMGRELDQRSFRRATYVNKSLRICFLGDEWSLSPYPGGLLCRDVRILHGRPSELLGRMERIVNKRLGYRVYWRGLSIIGDPSEMSVAQSLRLCWEFARNALLRPIRTVIRRLRKRLRRVA